MSTHAIKKTIVLTAAANGTGEFYSSVFTGPINALILTVGNLANTTDLAITLESTGQPVLVKTDVSASFINYPRVPMQDNLGADITYDGTRKVYEKVVAVEDRLKIVMAQAGDKTSGSLVMLVG